MILDLWVTEPTEGTVLTALRLEEAARVHHAELLTKIVQMNSKANFGMYTSSRTLWTAFKEAIEL